MQKLTRVGVKNEFILDALWLRRGRDARRSTLRDVRLRARFLPVLGCQQEKEGQGESSGETEAPWGRRICQGVDSLALALREAQEGEASGWVRTLVRV